MWWTCSPSHLPPAKSEMKTHLELIEELAQKRRDDARAAAIKLADDTQIALQKRLELWEPVLKVIREAVVAYPGRLELRNEQNNHSYLKFCSNTDGRWTCCELVNLDAARTGKPFVLRNIRGGEEAYHAVEDMIPAVMDNIATYLAKDEK